MPAHRKVFRAGDKLPGRLDDGCLACSECWTVKKRKSFLSRPRRINGEWRSLTLSICDPCRRRARRARESLLV